MLTVALVEDEMMDTMTSESTLSDGGSAALSHRKETGPWSR